MIKDKLRKEFRDKTRAIAATGGVMATIRKGFIVGSACPVGLAFFGAFVAGMGVTSFDILQPLSFAGLLAGAMLPYAFSALAMQAAANVARATMEFIADH